MGVVCVRMTSIRLAPHTPPSRCRKQGAGWGSHRIRGQETGCGARHTLQRCRAQGAGSAGGDVWGAAVVYPQDGSNRVGSSGGYYRVA